MSGDGLAIARKLILLNKRVTVAIISEKTIIQRIFSEFQDIRKNKFKNH